MVAPRTFLMRRLRQRVSWRRPEQGVLGLAVAGGGAADVVGAVVGEHEATVLGEVPVEAAGELARLTNGDGGVGEEGEGGAVDAQLGVAQRQLQGAEARMAEVDGVFGDDAVVGGVLEREDERRRQNPRRDFAGRR